MFIGLIYKATWDGDCCIVEKRETGCDKEKREMDCEQKVLCLADTM